MEVLAGKPNLTHHNREESSRKSGHRARKRLWSSGTNHHYPQGWKQENGARKPIGPSISSKVCWARLVCERHFPVSNPGGSDDWSPNSRVAFGPDGHFYGTIPHGYGALGSVYRLTPPSTTCKTAGCSWTIKEVHTFTNQGGDGGGSSRGDLI